MQGFHELEHKADLALKIYGSTIEELFRQAVLGFYSVLLPEADLKQIKPSKKQHSLAIEECCAETALVTLLNELNFLFTVKRLILLPVKTLNIQSNVSFVVHLKTGVLSEIPTEWWHNAREIKAVTYHDLRIERRDNLFTVRLIFDI